MKREIGLITSEIKYKSEGIKSQIIHLLEEDILFDSLTHDHRHWVSAVEVAKHKQRKLSQGGHNTTLVIKYCIKFYLRENKNNSFNN